MSELMMLPPDHRPSNNNCAASYILDLMQLEVSEPTDNCKLTKLPVELVHTICKSITNSSDLINLMVSCKYLTSPAEEVLWRACNARGYIKLSSMLVEQQEQSVKWVRTLSLRLEDSCAQLRSLNLRLPQLQELRVEHLNEDSQHSRMHIANLITPFLNRLELKNGTFDNFMPALALSKGLKYLEIGYRASVQGGDPMELSRLVNATPSLVTLYAGSMSSTKLFEDVALHMPLEDLSIASHITLESLKEVLDMPRPFANVQRLCLTTQASAAKLLLPKLSNLKDLELHIKPTLSPGETLASAAIDVFRTIGGMIKLRGLKLYMRGFSVQVQPEMLELVANMTRLKKLTMIHDLSPDRHLRNSSEFFAISRLCPLEQLHVDTEQRVPSRWVAKLARQHPGLKTLTLGSSVKIIPLRAHFPVLELLSLIRPTLPCRSTDIRNPLIRQTAAKMLAIAPRLKKVQVNLYSPTSKDVVISYEHNEQDITCTCTSLRDDDMIFTLPGPLISY